MEKQKVSRFLWGIICLIAVTGRVMATDTQLSHMDVACAQTTHVIKVACVGNSITYGFGVKDREHDSYPAQLQRMLGDSYQVGNFGRSGATLLTKGHRPYVIQPEYQQAKDFNADIVLIHLGINDTDPRN